MSYIPACDIPYLKHITKWIDRAARESTGEVQKELLEAAEHLQAVLDEVTA